jgi:hypothetical protein
LTGLIRIRKSAHTKRKVSRTGRKRNPGAHFKGKKLSAGPDGILRGFDGLKPQYIKITSAKRRFGSCSGKNGICFSWRLMRYPESAIDYVIVHELAHIEHKNHGGAFYDRIEAILPDLRERRKLLR